jgi:hypothetical protein
MLGGIVQPSADAEFARSQMVIVPALEMVWESSGNMEQGLGATWDTAHIGPVSSHPRDKCSRWMPAMWEGYGYAR